MHLVNLFIVLCCLSGGLTQNFLNCPGTDGIFKRCCSDVQLPNGCECFDISSGSSFSNSVFHKPQCPSDIGVTFKLFNPGTTGKNIRVGSTAPFDPDLPTRIVAHGFTDSGDAPWMIEMKDELRKATPCNVILVDWKTAAKGPNYYQAAANTRVVGAMIAKLIQDLRFNTGASFLDFHLIGHSLGAQIMGTVGKEIQRLEYDNIGRISALDPAGPAFESYDMYVRVDKTDAEFVDVMHTDAEPLLDAGFGMQYSVGHADFYPNGGKHQPGCPEETLGLLSMINFENEKDGGACSHGRAVDFFTNSINKCRYNSPTHGASCTMGYHTSKSCAGDHYPTTTGTEPFC